MGAHVAKVEVKKRARSGVTGGRRSDGLVFDIMPLVEDRTYLRDKHVYQPERSEIVSS